MRSGEVRAASRVDPGGGAARGCSGVKAATAAVVEERAGGDPGQDPGPEERSGEARAACRGDPRRRRRAPAERSVDGQARGPAREGQNQLEERSCKGSVRRAEQILGGAGVLARDKLTGLKMMGKVVELGARSRQGCAA
jgi:hypothetical protein